MSEMVSRVLKMRGMPWRTTEEEIYEFFADFEVEDVILEERDGKRTGYGLAFFPDEETAQAAREKKNKEYIGGRYVDLLFISSNDCYQ